MKNKKENKSTDPCDYCSNGRNTTGVKCSITACIEYSRWENNGTAPRNVVEKVEDFHYDHW